jgi:hypothetical protein
VAMSLILNCRIACCRKFLSYCRPASCKWYNQMFEYRHKTHSNLRPGRHCWTGLSLVDRFKSCDTSDYSSALHRNCGGPAGRSTLPIRWVYICIRRRDTPLPGIRLARCLVALQRLGASGTCGAHNSVDHLGEPASQSVPAVSQSLGFHHGSIWPAPRGDWRMGSGSSRNFWTWAYPCGLGDHIFFLPSRSSLRVVSVHQQTRGQPRGSLRFSQQG